MTAASRTTVTMPRARFEQLAAIAKHRNLPNPAAVIEAWINRAIAEGEIEPELPGISCERLGGEFLVSIRDTVLPNIPAAKARTLAAILSAAAGETDPELNFTMPAGKPVVLDLGEHNLAVARAGRSVRLVAKPKTGGDGVLSSVSFGFAAQMARQIRAEFTA